MVASRLGQLARHASSRQRRTGPLWWLMEGSTEPFHASTRAHDERGSGHDRSSGSSTSSQHTDPLFSGPVPHSLPQERQHERSSSYRDDEDEDSEDDDLVMEMQELGSHSHRPHLPRDKVHIPTPEQVQLWASTSHPRERHPKLVALGLVGLLLVALSFSQLFAIGTRFGPSGPKVNFILLISDGMGPASETLSRSFLAHLARTHSLNTSTAWVALAPHFPPVSSPASPYAHTTPLDEILVGTVRTRSANSLVTDSAAGATAFASGVHTYNGAIGVEPVDLKPVGTVLEAAKRQGFGTGLVATSRLTHATPAAFYSHVVDRDLESDIAPFLLGLGPQGHLVDIALGGGACFFAPNTSSTPPSCRTDARDLLAEAGARGRKVKVLRGLNELNQWHDDHGHDGGEEGDDLVLGLFHSDHMDYEIDREQITVVKDQQPSLKQMAMHALSHLDGRYKKGFFLMIEGSRIDMAGHNNDPIGHISDMLAYHTTIDYVRQWAERKNEAGERTLVMSVSDHETGGLSLGLQLGEAYPDYLWYPEVLTNATHSTYHLGWLIQDQDPRAVTPAWLQDVVYRQGLGIVDASTEEVAHLLEHKSDGYACNIALAQSISRRAQLGWSTHGHSGVDVNLYATGFNSTGLAGNRENTEIAEHIAHAMGLNLDVVTIELNKKLDWFQPDAGKVSRDAANRINLAHYHGDF